MRVTADRDGDGTVRVSMKLMPNEPNGFVFRGLAADYDRILTACLKNLYKKGDKSN